MLFVSCDGFEKQYTIIAWFIFVSRLSHPIEQYCMNLSIQKFNDNNCHDLKKGKRSITVRWEREQHSWD